MSSEKQQQLTPRYGIPNLEMLVPWIDLPAEEDGPFWALNLMKYREVADYGDATDGKAKVSGREADNAYTPREALAGVGAKLVFVADVIRQTGSHPTWDRIGIVKYPTRSSFMAMQLRDDFKAKHVHKDAGMEATIILAANPVSVGAPDDASDGTLVLRIARMTDSQVLESVDGAVCAAEFSVEGVMLGDDRTWNAVSFDVAPSDVVLDGLLAPIQGADESFSFALGNIVIDSLQASITDANI